MRTGPLTVLKGGINRLRVKGGARADTLYDLLNGYTTEDGTAKSRPGTMQRAQLPLGETKGLCSFKGELHVFSHEPVDPADIPDGYVCHTLYHPNYAADADDLTPFHLKKIHFAEPFLGSLYVVAEFEDGTVTHYWLQSGGTWTAGTTYRAGDMVEPTTPNGLAYRATRLGGAYPSWAPGVPRTEGNGSSMQPSIIEPTVYNDYFYVCVETVGANPVSGATEPQWPQEEGARVFEDTDGFEDSSAGTTTPPSGNHPSPGVEDRYGRVWSGGGDDSVI